MTTTYSKALPLIRSRAVRGTLARPSPQLFMVGLMFALAAAAPARAELIYRQVNLAYLTARADVIVQGRVAGVRYEGLPGYPHVPTVLVTLEVERMLRGPAVGRYTFREMLRPVEQYRKSAKRGYLVGERLLLFLPSPSQYGLTSPLGREQGRFHIARDPRGRDVISNELNNAGLFKDVPQKAEEEGVSLSPGELRMISVSQGRQGPQGPQGLVELKDFLHLVQTLTQLPRIE
jgi:hypothetical protein